MPAIEYQCNGTATNRTATCGCGNTCRPSPNATMNACESCLAKRMADALVALAPPEREATIRMTTDEWLRNLRRSLRAEDQLWALCARIERE